MVPPTGAKPRRRANRVSEVLTRASATRNAEVAESRLACVPEPVLLSDDARSVRLYLKPDTGDVPVRAALILWDPETGVEDPITIDDYDVVVLSGPSLAGWLSTIKGERLRPDQVEAAWCRMEKHLSDRDASDLRRNGPPPRPLADLASEWFTMALAVIAGVAASATLVRWFGALGLVLTATVLFGIGWFGLRFPKTRMTALAWIGGTQFVTVAFVAALAFSWLR